jgi:hypothetical protein
MPSGPGPISLDGRFRISWEVSWEFTTISHNFARQNKPLTRDSRAGDETRTRNLLFTRQLRYRLRHASTTAISPGRRPSAAEDEIRIRRPPPDERALCVCHQVRGTIHGLLSDGTDHVSIHVARDRMLAYPTSSALMPTTAIRELLEVCTTPPRTGHQEPSTLHTRCTHRGFRPSYVAVTCRADKCSSIGSQSGAHCAPLDVRSKTPAT